MAVRHQRAGRSTFLTVCEGGTVRSVGLAFMLKTRGFDALAASWRWNPPETLDLLCRWATRIIVVQPEFVEKISPAHRKKITVYDVGPDTYGNPLSFALCFKFLKYMAQDRRMPGLWQKKVRAEVRKLERQKATSA